MHCLDIVGSPDQSQPQAALRRTMADHGRRWPYANGRDVRTLPACQGRQSDIIREWSGAGAARTAPPVRPLTVPILRNETRRPEYQPPMLRGFEVRTTPGSKVYS